MKLIIRLIVLIVVALFIFTGGFWLGKQWKGGTGGTPDGNLLANLPGQEAASPTPEDAKTVASKEKVPPAPAKEKQRILRINPFPQIIQNRKRQNQNKK